MTTRSILPSNAEPLSQSVWAIAVAAVTALVAAGARYGFHTDELYLTATGRHLDWGYIDQGPAVPAINRAVDYWAGVSPLGLRVISALCIGGIVLLVGWMAARMGARPVGQMVAALSGGFSGFALSTGHLFTASVFDALAWTICLAFLVAILDQGSPRLWMGLGLAFGISFYFKPTIVLLAAVSIPLVVILRPRAVKGIWPWVGLLATAAVLTPGMLWQQANDWPYLEVAQAMIDSSGSLLQYSRDFLVMFSLILLVPFVGGIYQIWVDPNLKRWRPLTLVYPILAIGLAWFGRGAHIAFPATFPVFAGASIWYEERTAKFRRLGLLFTLIVLAATSLVALPILEPDSAGLAMRLNPDLGETVGWKENVGQIGVVYTGLTPEQQNNAVIFAESYGQASAFEVFGAGLPQAYSGQNSFWDWGPPSQHGTIIGVGAVADDLAPICPTIEEVASLTTPFGVENDQSGSPIWICPEPTGSLADIWDNLKHYD